MRQVCTIPADTSSLTGAKSARMLAGMENNQRLKEYLGDGAYVEWNGYAFVLTTEDGISVQNTVEIEPRAFSILVGFARQIGVEVPA
jgi:hypothetical protein